jgi:hypothetical protein
MHLRREAVPTLEDRENAFEAKFAHDEEFQFLVDARRDKLFAHWAASAARIKGAAEDALVSDVLGIPNGPEHDAAILRHIRGVLAAHGSAVVDPHLAAALYRCAAAARRLLTEHPPEGSEVV